MIDSLLTKNEMVFWVRVRKPAYDLRFAICNLGFRENRKSAIENPKLVNWHLYLTP
jgi:hypothetical protein